MKKRTQSKNTTSYTYYAYDPETGREVPHVLEAGTDGVTEDWIILLQEMDHDDALQERYEDENHDGLDKHYKNAVQTGNERAMNPVEQKAYAAFLRDDPEENPAIEMVRGLIWNSLSDEQIDLVYQLFGACRQGTEIAAEQGVTQQAVDGRKKRILTKMKKLLEE